MANSKNTVTTIPLASKLNMNRNQTQVCTTYDQMNAQNSPLYGGCISPLHYKEQYAGKQSIIDKYGKRWYYNGTGLYRSDENNTNTVLARNFSGYYTFTDEIMPSCDAAVYSGGYLWTARKINGYQVKITVYTGTAQIYTTTVSQDSTYTLKSIRYVSNPQNANMPCLITTAEGNNLGTPKVLVVVHRVSTGGIAVAASKYINLHLVVGNQLTVTVQNNINAPGGGSAQSSINTYPIIVSDALTINGTAGLGITVLSRHLDGENVLSNFGYCNLYWNGSIYTCQLTLNSGLQNWGSNYTVPLCGQANDAYPASHIVYTGGKTINVNQSGNNNQLVASGITTTTFADWNIYTGTGWGIFQDGNNEWVIGNYSPDGWTALGYAGAEGASYMSHVAVSVDCGGSAIAYTDYTTHTATTLQDNVFLVSGKRDGQNGIFNYAYGYNAAGVLWSVANQTLATNQYHYRMVFSGQSKENGYGSTKTTGVSVMLDSMAYGQVRTWPGVLSTSTIPTTNEGWNTAFANRYTDDLAIYNTSGSCTQLGSWRLLFNYREGYLSGVSFANNPNYEGTLITPWDEVDDGFVVSANGNTIIWKDIAGKVHKTTAVLCTESNLLTNTEIVDNRYLVIKCSAPQNVFDLVTEEWGKFGSDWNNRVLQGYTRDWEQYGMAFANKPCCTNWNANEQLIYGSLYNTASWASGFNVAYQATKTFSPSRLLPAVTGNYTYTGSPLVIGCIRPIDEVGIGTVDKTTLDYFCSSGSSAPKFAGSLTGTANGQVSTDFESASLQGTSYPITSTGSLYNNPPILNLHFVNSYNGKFAVQIGNKGYSMVYDGVRPVMLYNATSMVDNIKEFFIVQSQTYAVVDSYICAISYSSSNVINGIEQLVDVNGMQFVGAFPSVAYFYSPASRSLYAFTGDADLQLFVQTDRISTVYTHLYAPNNEWIYLATNDGMYVITQQNIFRVPWSDLGITDPSTVTFYMTDDAWDVIQHYVGDYRGIKVRLDLPDATWATLPIVLETEYFGQGDMKQEVCDTWYIRLFKGDEEYNRQVILSTKTLTDTVTESDTKTMIITPDMWDSSNNTFIRYQPQYQMTQGSSLHIESYYPIAYLGVSHQMDNTSNSKFNI